MQPYTAHFLLKLCIRMAMFCGKNIIIPGYRPVAQIIH